jgi:hypothetical protein
MTNDRCKRPRNIFRKSIKSFPENVPVREIEADSLDGYGRCLEGLALHFYNPNVLLAPY